MASQNVLTNTDRLIQEIDVPVLVNPGLECPSYALLEEIFGRPRIDFSAQCRPPTSESFKNYIKTGSVGPFSVTGFHLAVDSLAAIMSEVKQREPVVYHHLGTAGMLCCRYMRNAGQKLSSHSWGTAIDLTLCGRLDTRGNRKVFAGLALIAPIFNRHGWYWGAKFRTEDAMHFEVGKAKLLSWQSSANSVQIEAQSGPLAPTRHGPSENKVLIKLGDKGDAVTAIQKNLLSKWYRISVDGIFGGETEKAVKSFQLKSGLQPDGIVGEKTLQKLRS